MIVAIAIVSGLLAVNALFVAAEFAIVGTPRTAIEELAATGNARAEAVARILRDPRRQDRYIATAQLGITVASLGLGMYGEPKLAGWIADRFAFGGAPAWLASHALAGVIALVALTYLHIVLGEMVPKSVALAKPQRAAMWITPLMLSLQIATYPLVALLNGIGNAILRAAGIQRRFGGSDRLITAEELSHIVRDSQRSGMLGSEAADVVDELIDFGRLNAREVMVPRVKIFGLEVGAGLDELTEILTLAPHARYPVYAHDLDHIVGMVHIRDVARCVREHAAIRQADIRPIPFLPGSSPLDTVLAAMREANSQMAVVMDEHGGTDGILTTEDLFEEVVGDIPDTASDAPPDLYVAEDGLHVAGTVRVEELGEELGRRLEHHEVDTVSGLVLALLDRPPEVGDRVRYDGVELEVTSVIGHGVAECRARLAEHSSDPPTTSDRDSS